MQDPAGILWPGSTMNLFARETLLPAGTAVVAKIAGMSLVLAAPLPAGVGQWDLVNNAASYADYVEVCQLLVWPYNCFGPGLSLRVPQVSDCVFKDNRARGALLKSSNVLATRNTFDHTTGPAIKTETDGGWGNLSGCWRALCRPSRPVEDPVCLCPTGCYWFEGHPVRNWTVVGNTFIGCNYATAATVSAPLTRNSCC